jgi:hypothetical protein
MAEEAVNPAVTALLLNVEISSATADVDDEICPMSLRADELRFIQLRLARRQLSGR